MICPLRVLTLGSINHFYTHSKYLFGSRILIIRKNSRVKGRFNIIFWRFDYRKWQIFAYFRFYKSLLYFFKISLTLNVHDLSFKSFNFRFYKSLLYSFKISFWSKNIDYKKKLRVKGRFNINFWRLDYRKWQIFAYLRFYKLLLYLFKISFWIENIDY